MDYGSPEAVAERRAAYRERLAAWQESRQNQDSTPAERYGPWQTLQLLWPYGGSVPYMARRRTRLYFPKLSVRESRVPAQICQMFRACVTAQSAWPLVIVGGTRTGKTHAAICMMDAVGQGCQYIDTGQIASLLRRSVEQQDSFMDAWTEAPLCVLDELGTRSEVTDAQFQMVKRLIDQRMNDCTPLVVISNLGLDDLAKVYDDRISARLNEGTVVEVTERFDAPAPEGQQGQIPF